jgi:hypothetical protein
MYIIAHYDEDGAEIRIMVSRIIAYQNSDKKGTYITIDGDRNRLLRETPAEIDRLIDIAIAKVHSLAQRETTLYFGAT